MIRRLIVALVKVALRIYFQRIEVTGLEHVPLDTPVIFVLNHPNALVDPVFLLCLAPRKVSFLAKEPLFRMPVISYLVKSMEFDQFLEKLNATRHFWMDVNHLP